MLPSETTDVENASRGIVAQFELAVTQASCVRPGASKNRALATAIGVARKRLLLHEHIHERRPVGEYDLELHFGRGGRVVSREYARAGRGRRGDRQRGSSDG